LLTESNFCDISGPSGNQEKLHSLAISTSVVKVDSTINPAAGAPFALSP